MKIYKLESHTNSSYIRNVAYLHRQAFPDFFLTQLGISFLETLYLGYIEDLNSGIIVAEDESNNLLGFIAYSTEYSQFYKNLIKHHIVKFAFYSILAAIRHPSYIKRLVGAFKKSEEVERTEKYVELASIGVNPNSEGKGIGSKLIDYLKEIIDLKEYAYINLETDADNNEGANRFYRKNGFELARTYITSEGRRMNEYHYVGIGEE